MTTTRRTHSIQNDVDFYTSEHLNGEGSIIAFLYGCINALELGMGFHPDTDFNEYIYKIGDKKDKRCFTKRQAKALNETLNEAHQECERLGLDIYAIGLEIMQPILDKAFK